MVERLACPIEEVGEGPAPPPPAALLLLGGTGAPPVAPAMERAPMRHSLSLPEALPVARILRITIQTHTR